VTSRPPRITIGVPVFNAESHLPQALDSIRSQTFESFEVIISDNASTDGTEEIARSYVRQDARFRYRRNPENIGAARNYNLLFREASSEYFKWMPYDDVMAPTFLSRCIEMLDKDRMAVLATSRVALIDENGTPTDFDQRFRQYAARRRLRHVPVDRAPNLGSSDPSLRFADVVLRKVWFFEVYGVIRSTALERTPLLALYTGSCQVMLAELSLLGPFRMVEDQLYSCRFPYFYASDPRSDAVAGKNDPDWARRIHFPQAQIAWGYLRAAARARGADTKLRCIGTVIHKILEPDNLAKLLVPGPNNYLGLDLTPVPRASASEETDDAELVRGET
jgi:glycosyltransferase involved in cell wall biosynthesis